MVLAVTHILTIQLIHASVIQGISSLETRAAKTGTITLIMDAMAALIYGLLVRVAVWVKLELLLYQMEVDNT